MMGYSREELLQLTSLDMIHPDDRQASRIRFSAMQNRQVERLQVERRFIRKDGSVFWGLLSVTLTDLPVEMDILAVGVIVDISDRKQAEEALRESEEKYRALYEYSMDGIILNTPDGRVLAANPAACRMLGHSEDEIKQLGQAGVTDITDPRLPAALEERWRSGVFKGELTLVRKDGTKFPAELTSVIYRGSGGEEKSSMVLRDITRRKQAEEALRQASAYNRSLIEASLDPLVMIGPDGKITDVNSATEAVTGYTRQQLIGTDFSDYFTQPERARAGYQQVFREGVVRDYALELRHRDGSVTSVLYNASVYRDEAGQVSGVFAAARDITQLKRIKEALRTSEERFRTLTELSPVGVYMTDAQGKCVYANPRWCEMTGLSPQEALGDGWIQALYPEDRQRIGEAWQQMVESRGEWGLEYRFEDRRGKVTWVYGVAAALFDSDKQITGYIGVNLDITELKRAEERLQALLAEREILVRETYHRVKNNYMMVISMLGLQAGQVQDQAARSMLEESMSRLRSLSLIHENLHKSKDLGEVNSSEYLCRLAREVFYANYSKLAAIELLFDVEDVPLSVETTLRCGLIVNELISNALKHAFPGGRSGHVTVELHRDPGGAAQGAQGYILKVSDDGVGFPPEVDFRNTQSLGLQLVNILATLDLQGSFEMEPGPGTGFVIRFS